MGLIMGALAASEAHAQSSSSYVTWTCTSSPCPWGSSTSNDALVWPASLQPLQVRLGYTVSAGVYLPAASANGLTVTLLSGSAAVYAGEPGADSHSMIGAIVAGDSYTISGLASGEVVSVQSNGSFSYTLSGTSTGVTPPPPPPPPPAPTPSDPSAPTSSSHVTWTCTGSPCPWGSSTSGEALVWPASLGALTTRLGYDVSAGIYLPAASANGLVITLASGSASAYAGLPSESSHHSLGSLSVGHPFTISGLASGEVVSIQSNSSFTFTLATGSAPAPSEPAPGGESVSTHVIWSCATGPCPWGASTSGEAVVWPASAYPLNTRLGYTVSAGIYLPAASANGLQVTIVDGSATIYAGAPSAASHSPLKTLSAGGSFVISGVASDQVVSVQSGSIFTFTTSAVPAGTPTPTPTAPTLPPGVIPSTHAYWQCNTPGCDNSPWEGQVISWPSWAAYQSNARSGSDSRSVFSADGTPLYPYMGTWAEGCTVTTYSGVVLIIEWERGTDDWRETRVDPGQTYTIHLHSPENNAMIETFDGMGPFAVSLQNCNPQPLP